MANHSSKTGSDKAQVSATSSTETESRNEADFIIYDNRPPSLGQQTLRRQNAKRSELSGSFINSSITMNESMIQRQLIVGKEDINENNLKELRTDIRHSLNSSDYRDWLITSDAWFELEKMVSSDAPVEFNNSDEIVEWFANKKLIKQGAKRRKGNPNTKGAPAKFNRFSKRTKNRVKLEKGEHRRHIIGRHTIRQAIERSELDSIEAMQEFVEKWGGQASSSVEALLDQAYVLMQDAPGNLWAGDGGQNTAIGFFTGGIYDAAERALDATIQSQSNEAAIDDASSNAVPLDAIASEIENLNIFDFAKSSFEELKELYWARVLESSTPLSSNGKLFIDADSLIDITYDMASTCEYDPPESENQSLWLDVLDELKTSNTIFSSGIADDFMSLAANRDGDQVADGGKDSDDMEIEL